MSETAVWIFLAVLVLVLFVISWIYFIFKDGIISRMPSDIEMTAKGLQHLPAQDRVQEIKQQEAAEQKEIIIKKEDMFEELRNW